MLFKQILITGSSGQIGTKLGKELESKDFNLLGIDRVLGSLSKKKFIQIDLTKKNNLKKIKSKLKNVDAVIHLASKIDGSKDIIKDGTKNIELNISSTLELINNLPNLKHFFYASTYMVYGIPKTNPIKEEHNTCPTNIYGACKLITEKYLDVISKNMKFNLTILRFMGIYGTYTLKSWQAIPSFISSIKNNKNPIIYGNGKEKRNHIYMDDAIKAILCSLKSKKSGVYNIGGTSAPSNLHIIDLINKKLGKSIKPKFIKSNNQYDFISDTSSATNQLKFIPTKKFDKGLSETIELYLNH